MRGLRLLPTLAGQKRDAAPVWDQAGFLELWKGSRPAAAVQKYL